MPKSPSRIGKAVIPAAGLGTRSGRNKRPLEDHFDRTYQRESAPEKKGYGESPAKVQESGDLVTTHYVRQRGPRSLGHAVLCAAPHLGHERFASSSVTTSSTRETPCSRA